VSVAEAEVALVIEAELPDGLVVRTHA